MDIHRLQTLFLLLAVVCIGVFCCTPFAIISKPVAEATQIYAKDAPIMLTVSLLIGVLLFIAVFLYKNLKLQKTVTLVSMVLLAAAIVTGFFIVYSVIPGAQLIIFGGLLLLFAALVCALAAYRGINRDHKTLKELNSFRLR